MRSVRPSPTPGWMDVWRCRAGCVEGIQSTFLPFRYAKGRHKNHLVFAMLMSWRVTHAVIDIVNSTRGLSVNITDPDREYFDDHLCHPYKERKLPPPKRGQKKARVSPPNLRATSPSLITPPVLSCASPPPVTPPPSPPISCWHKGRQRTASSGGE